MKTKINFSIIGCGRIAQRHAKHISKHGKLISVCDIDFKKAKELGMKYNCSYYKSIEEMFENSKDIDVVSICSPNGLHSIHSIKSLKNGFNVLCEKPMALSPHDCGEMIKEAEKSNKRLFIVKQNRFNPPVIAVKKAIDNGKLGKIYNIHLSCFWNRNSDYYMNSWKGTKNLDGGTLFTQFSHFIDLIYWMIGDVKKVYALTENFNHKNDIEFEDSGVVALEFYTGTIGTINYSVNSYNQNMEGSLTILGEKGSVKIGGQYINELEYQNFKDYKIEKLPTGNKPNNYGFYQGSMSNHGEVYKNLVDVLVNGKSISTNSFEGLKTIEIIHKIYSSSKNNK